MCGIVGIVNFDRSPIDVDILKAMSHSISHRGPDDKGYLGVTGESGILLDREAHHISGSWIGFGHRRLSIIDLSDNGWQPMSSIDGRYFIVYNGEVYNYVELKQQLEAAGHKFKSTSDTEVVLTAYIEWGRDALTRFVGMFAFVILDMQTKELFLARDHFGIKPLYYNFTDRTFSFASEIKALLLIPEMSKYANAQVVFDFLRYARSDHSGETFLRNVRQIPPGHFLVVPLEENKDRKLISYWNPSFNAHTTMPFNEASNLLRDMFLDNVTSHLRSDVPVGAALSGGIDSSSVVSCIRHIDPNRELHTFSYVADIAGDGELKWATMVGNSVGAQLHMIRPSEEDMVNDLQRLTYIQDEPFASTNMYAQYLVYGLAKQNGIKVVMDGQGADELMAGYDYFYHHKIDSMLRHGKLVELFAFMRAAARVQPDFNPFTNLIHGFSGLLPSPIMDGCRHLIGKECCPSWINKEWFKKCGVSDRSYSASKGKSCFKKAMYQSLTMDSLPMLLRWQDRNSMAHSVESRVPFLTPKFAEYLLSLPDEYLISQDGTRKSILRSAMRDIVPKAVLTRLDKVAFGSPMTAWLSRLTPWIDKVLHADVVEDIPVFAKLRLRTEWAEVMNGRRPLRDHVWRCISLIKWVECFGIKFEEA
jgi:asparagine synthase (glutamine-hydrolysing)